MHAAYLPSIKIMGESHWDSEASYVVPRIQTQPFGHTPITMYHPYSPSVWTKLCTSLKMGTPLKIGHSLLCQMCSFIQSSELGKQNAHEHETDLWLLWLHCDFHWRLSDWPGWWLVLKIKFGMEWQWFGSAQLSNHQLTVLNKRNSVVIIDNAVKTGTQRAVKRNVIIPISFLYT